MCPLVCQKGLPAVLRTVQYLGGEPKKRTFLKLRVLKYVARPGRANIIHFLGYLLEVDKQAELNRKVKVKGRRFGQCDLGGGLAKQERAICSAPLKKEGSTPGI